MIIAQELINDNGISAFALAFFTALFGMVGTVIVTISRQRQELKELKNDTSKASDNAEKAQQNTIPVSNGFTARMDRKLDLLATNQDRLEHMQMETQAAIQRHMEWHINKETP